MTGVPKPTRSKRVPNPFKTYAEPRKRKFLASQGKRSKRLAQADRACASECHDMPCICGCNQPAQWAHLSTRGHESTRHEDWNSIPLCALAHRWLDQTADGVRCRAVLLEMAQAKGERLTSAETWPVFDEHGLYAWMEERRLY